MAESVQEVTLTAVFKRTWETVTRSPAAFFGLGLVSAAASVGLLLLLQLAGWGPAVEENAREVTFTPFNALVMFLGAVAVLLVALVVQSGILSAALKALPSKKEVSFQEAYQLGLKNVKTYVLVSFVTGLIIIAGFIALIIPGIILAVILSLSVPAALDKNLGVVDAMKTSQRLVSKNWFIIVLFGLALIGISIVATLVFPRYAEDVATSLIAIFGLVGTVDIYLRLK